MGHNLDTNVPLVSIGVPVRNGGDFLRETIDSLLALEFRSFEIVVSDNMSDDGTPGILAEYAERDSRIRVFRQSEVIPALDNFKFVLEKARGQYFAWNAHDDMRSPESLTLLVDALSDPEVACAMTDVVNLYEETGSLGVDELDLIRRGDVDRDWITIRSKFFDVPTSNIFHCFYGLMRREVAIKCPLELIRGKATNLEIPFLASASLMGKIVSVRHQGFFYRRHSNSLYHQELTAGERGEFRSKRSVIRRMLLRIILRSSLPVSEKWSLIAPVARVLISEGAVNFRASVAKGIKKRMVKMKKFSLRRTLRLVKRRIFGIKGKPPGEKQRNRPGEKGKNRQDRAGKRNGGKNRKLRSVLETEVNLDVPDVAVLVERERARARLEASGWTFAEPKRLKLINGRRITTILDCGANAGQYVDDLKAAGWKGEVYSFEPLSEAYAKLRARAEASERWRTFHFALGERNEESTIQIAGNSYSSSLLEFSNDFKELLPAASPVGTETVTIRRLDDVVNEEGIGFDGPVMLKLDVQGFELSVLRGAEATLNRISVIQCELALVTSYEGGATFSEVRDYLRERGFVLAHIIDGHASRETGELREVDGLFLNTKLEAGR
jgi:FkbM family methyltransferase